MSADVAPGVRGRGMLPALERIVGRRVFFVCDLLILLLLSNVIVGLKCIAVISAGTDRVQHAQDAQAALDTAESALHDAEAGQRAYILTGAQQDRSRYAAAHDAAAADAAALVRLVSGDADLRAGADAVQQRVTAALAALQQGADLRAQGRATDATRSVSASGTRAALDAARQAIAALNSTLASDEAQAKLAARQDTVQAGVILAILVVADGVLIILVFMLIARALDWRDRLVKEQAHALKGELARRQRAWDDAEANTAELLMTLECIADGVAVYDADGHLLRENGNLRTLLGYDAGAEMARGAITEARRTLGIRDGDGVRLTLEQLPAMRALKGEVLTGDAAMDLRLSARDGREVWLSASAAPILGEGGRIVGAVTVYRDVTARRTAARAVSAAFDDLLALQRTLAASVGDGGLSAQQYTQRLVESLAARLVGTSVAVATLDPATGALQPLAVAGLAPDQAERWREAVRRTSLDDHYDADDAARLRAGEMVLHEVRQAGEEANAAAVDRTFTMPMRAGDRLLGIVEVVETRAAEGLDNLAAVLAASAAQLAALAIDREQIIRDNDAVVRSFYQSSPMLMGIAQIVDGDVRIDSCNVATAALAGRTPEAMRGMTARELGVPDDLAETWVYYGREAARSGEPVRFEYEWRPQRHGDGGTAEDVRHMAATFCPIPMSSGGDLRFSYIIDDITERKQLEEQLKHLGDAALEASRLKSEFLANMSHEIRTPLNGVLGMTELLLGTALSLEQREYAKITHSSATGLLSIINEILDFSKIEAGKLTVESIDVDVRSVVEDVADVLVSRIRDKDVALLTFVSPELDTALLGDPSRLRQVLLNLAGNAVKFTERGEVTLWALPQEVAADHVTVRFEVVDTGIGLSPAVRERLFRPFTQADGSTSRKYGGTGLGLSICKRLVELMGGQIGVNSIEGRGSTFWFTVPFPRAAQSANEAAPALPARPLPAARVLVAAGRPAQAAIIQRYLTAWGVRSDRADASRSVAEALRQAEHAGDPYTAALVDASLPEEEREALARASAEDDALRATRLLLLVPIDRLEQGRRALAAGFAGFLPTPLKAAQLRRALSGEDAAMDGAAVTTVEPANGGPTAPSADAATPPREVSACRILVAEDNPVNQKLTLWQLQRLGYTATVVSNGREAVEALAAAAYDLVLMDCQMPELDGYAATRQVRAAEAGGVRRVPIIAMTANALQGDREACLKAGMDDYISKPVQLEELRAAVERWEPKRPAPRRPSQSELAAPAADDPPAADAPAGDSALQPDTPTLDVSAWEPFRAGGDASLDDLLDTLLATTPVELGAMRAALMRDDTGALRRLAHKLVSGSFPLGAVAFTQLCAALEAAAGAGDLGRCADLVGRIVAEYTRLGEAIARERGRERQAV